MVIRVSFRRGVLMVIVMALLFFAILVDSGSAPVILGSEPAIT
jgi:hypothetical protein